MTDKEELRFKEEPEFSGELIDVPTIYIDGMQGAMNLSGVFKINLFEYVQDFSDDPEVAVKRRMVGRLALTEATLLGVQKWMQELVGDVQERLKKQEDGKE